MTIILDSSGTPREVTNWGADEIIKQRETITAQAVVIEKLREALMTVKPHVQCDPYAVVIRALSIPDDSAQVLKEWLDNEIDRRAKK